MVNHMTHTEESKVFEITERLRRIPSPALRLQVILQFSQIVDIITLGDTSEEKISDLLSECDRLQDEINTSSLEAPEQNNPAT